MKIQINIAFTCESDGEAVMHRIFTERAGLKDFTRDHDITLDNGASVTQASKTLDVPSWSAGVMEALNLTNELGKGWHLSGDVREDLSLLCTNSFVPGLSKIHVELSK
ncbi:hypothetical protein QGN29_10750 [Temperatibacter marinus]|uniref:Uncharacterized protein n=1 Tax=Temperatibacter marinus TaxID=1456591 RepID=A0AA52EC66_9PROT|nr:hypothetical protein [Temperatibacter marinus]WND02025.1 hypothetical protein QGN29_10750 [Temperatibacter marinus]